MEAFSQVLQNIKDRFTNPLIFSFLISWALFNWEAIIALFWFDTGSIGSGYETLTGIIREQTNSHESFWYPLSAAFAYTFLFPIFKNFLTAFHTWNIRWGDNLSLRISKASNVPIEKYLQLRASYSERTSVLEDIIKSERTTQEELERMRTALLESRNQLNKTSGELSEQRAITDTLYDMSWINGTWIKSHANPMNDQNVIENIEIQSGIFYEHHIINRNEKFHIENFLYDKRRKRVTFCLFHYKKAGEDGPSGFYSFSDLRYEHHDLVGTEYANGNSVLVKYSRP